MAIVAAQNDSVRASLGEPIQTWQQAMKSAVRDPVELCQALSLPSVYHAAAVRAARVFPVFAPRGFLARMQPGDPADPLLRQVLPLEDELVEVDQFTADPVGDNAATLRPGLIKKYPGRALLIASGACAVHCRYCFRRHFPYAGIPHGIDEWQAALSDLRADPTIDEIILSGGDPLTLIDGQLTELFAELAGIRHLRRLRVHTRLPIVIPERITAALLAALRGTRLTPLVVVHANHPAELDAQVDDALGQLIEAGIPVMNQAVLLRGVNDNADVLADLCRHLVNVRVIPYYLHQLDRVAGAAHYEVPIDQGRELVKQLQSRLPGYAVPRYVQEVDGEPSKIPLARLN